jgi:hypothetical protein
MQRVPLFDITSMHVLLSLSLSLSLSLIYDSICPCVAPLDTLAGALQLDMHGLRCTRRMHACMQCFA